MTGKERRNAVFHTIKDSKGPVSGKELAEKFGVSRQVIVQDMALIRAKGYEIISTNRGYLLNAPQSVSRVFQVCHTDEELREELYVIVDLGGRVKNVMVEHQVYGHLEAELNVTSRRTAEISKRENPALSRTLLLIITGMSWKLTAKRRWKRLKKC